VVLLSDGSDNSGGIDLKPSGRSAGRTPVHTIGFGREGLARDVEVSDVSLPARALADSRLYAESRSGIRLYAEKARLVVREATGCWPRARSPKRKRRHQALVFNAGSPVPAFSPAIESLAGERMSKQPAAPGECDVRQTAHPLFRRHGGNTPSIAESKTTTAQLPRWCAPRKTSLSQGIRMPRTAGRIPSKPELFAFDGLITR
jgi:hypothetical protein